MTKGLQTTHYAVSVAVLAAALLLGGSLSAPATFSSEVGFFSFSPRGAAGGAVVPASCEVPFEHSPGECAVSVDLKVNGSDGPLNMGEPANYVVGWTSANVSSCTASGAWSGSKATSGAENNTNIPTGSYTYTITCPGSFGGSASDSVTVSVSSSGGARYSCSNGVCVADPIGPYTTPSCSNTCGGGGGGPVPGVDLKVNGSDGPLTFEALAGYTASWTTSNTNQCVASGAWSGSKATPSGSESFSNVGRGTYVYGLTCNNTNGSASDSVQVNVIQVPQCTFAPSPTSIILPQTSTLFWSCQFADSCVIDQGIGSVNNVSGSREVQPQQTTLYTLTCQGADGQRSYPGTVRVFSPSLREILPR